MDRNVIVPVNCVDTFDTPDHPAEQMNFFALSSMKSNGIKVVSEII